MKDDVITDSPYVLQVARKTRCQTCNGEVDMLCSDDLGDDPVTNPWFYICWTCKEVGQVGLGPVPRGD